jgi:hypothetical protein
VTSELAHRLRLSPMVAENDAPHGTAFTVSVDYKHGTTTWHLGRRPRRHGAQSRQQQCGRRRLRAPRATCFR